MKTRNPKTLLTWLLGAAVLGLYAIFATGCAAEMPSAPSPELSNQSQLGTLPAPDATQMHIAL